MRNEQDQELEAAADALLGDALGRKGDEYPVLRPGREQFLAQQRGRRGRGDSPLNEDLAAVRDRELDAVPERTHVRQLLHQAGLTPMERAVLMLAEGHRWSEDELGDLFGVTYRTVRRVKARALGKLRDGGDTSCPPSAAAAAS